MNVDKMTRAQLLAHAKKCLHCTGGDPHMLTAIKESTTTSLRDYIASTHHDPRWQAVTRRDQP